MKRLPLNPEESQSNINNLTVTPPPHRRCFGTSDKMTFIRYVKGKAFQYTFNGFFFNFRSSDADICLAPQQQNTFFPPSEVVCTVLVWFCCGSLQP